MDLNNDAGEHRKLLDILFRLSKEVEVSADELAIVDDATAHVCQSFVEKKYREVIDAKGSSGPAIVQHFEGYLRAESALKLFLAKQLSEVDFNKFLNSENLPSYVKSFYRGIVCYKSGLVREAYAYFAETRIAANQMVLTYARFIDGSIRGAMSAITIDEMELIYPKDSEVSADADFPYILDEKSTRSRSCHVVACDYIYWEKYSKLFKRWSASLVAKIDVWLVPVNFSLEQLEELRSDNPEIYVAQDNNSIKNLIPYYTMVRFILAEKLLRLGKYDSASCSDIDMFVDTNAFEKFVYECEGGGSGVFLRGAYPWRSTGAELTVWKGDAGRSLLSWMVAYFKKVFRPEITGRNRQWWIDQFALALFADMETLQTDFWMSEKLKFNIIDNSAVPTRSPTKDKLSKDDFVALYGNG